MTAKNLIVIAGAGGHAKVVADIITRTGRFKLSGATDRRPDAAPCGLKMLGTDSILPALLSSGTAHAAVGLGASRDTKPRGALFSRLKALGFQLPPLIHPGATVAESAELGEGCQVMAAAVVNPGVKAAANCVINTGAVVEHDCVLEEDSFICPGAVLGGGVFVGAGAFIGLGAVVLPRVRIGSGAVIGAGAVVLKDVPAGKTAVGIPAAIREVS